MFFRRDTQSSVPNFKFVCLLFLCRSGKAKVNTGIPMASNKMVTLNVAIILNIAANVSTTYRSINLCHRKESFWFYYVLALRNSLHRGHSNLFSTNIEPSQHPIRKIRLAVQSIIGISAYFGEFDVGPVKTQIK